MKVIEDEDRLDWLEYVANKLGGLLLHGEGKTGRLGLGLKNTGRTIREAIDDAIMCYKDWCPLPDKESGDD